MQSRCAVTLLAVVLLTISGIHPAFGQLPQDRLFEAEDYLSYSETGGVRIHAVRDPCDGGYLLVGLDAPNEWTRYAVTLANSYYAQPHMRCRGISGSNYRLNLTFTPSGGGSTGSFTFDFTATGLQCGTWISPLGSGDGFPARAALYTAKLTLLFGSSLQIDYVGIGNMIVGTEATTWGAIKSLFQ